MGIVDGGNLLAFAALVIACDSAPKLDQSRKRAAVLYFRMRTTHREFTRDLQLIVKRAFDIAISAIVLLIFSPLFLLASLAIKLETAGAIFSVKHVYCYNNLHIPILSFRTRSHRSVTSGGRALVRTGLDRLPMLINVLRGEMSIVGPHFYVLPPPQLYDRLPPVLLDGPFKPGLVSFEPSHADRESSRTDADLFYISNWSLVLDLMILFRYLFSKDTYFQNRRHD
jgi:lipopolysaccharide/colanic/teichoic acid biosynthesis glycosyltransferase